MKEMNNLVVADPDSYGVDGLFKGHIAKQDCDTNK